MHAILAKQKKLHEKTKSRKVKQERLTQCPQCGSTDLSKDTVAGEVTCISCGMVLKGRMISDEKEWREFEGDEKSKRRARVGGPTNDLIDNMATTIGKGSRNAAQLSRIQRESSLTPEQKLLQKGFEGVDALGKKLNLYHKFKNQAKQLYKELTQKGFLKGKNRKLWTSACVYVACEMEGSPRTMQQVAAVAQFQVKQLARATIQLKNNLKIKTNLKTPQFYIKEFCKRLKVTQYGIEVQCLKVAQHALELSLFRNRSPMTRAAAIVYFVLKERNLLQGRNMAATGVTIETIRKACEELDIHRETLIPKKEDNRPQVTLIGRNHQHPKGGQSLVPQRLNHPPTTYQHAPVAPPPPSRLGGSIFSGVQQRRQQPMVPQHHVKHYDFGLDELQPQQPRPQQQQPSSNQVTATKQ